MATDELLAFLPGLRSGRPDPVRRFFNAAVPSLRALLRRRFPILPVEMIQDAVTDTLLLFRDQHERFQPERGSLLNFLVHIGGHLLLDELRRQKRRKEISVGGNVELELLEAKNYREEAYLEDTWQDADSLPPDVESLLLEVLPDPIDRKILDLSGSGRHSVADYAAVLGIDHLPPEEQKVRVKRERDRVLKKVQRRREEFRRRLFDG